MSVASARPSTLVLSAALVAFGCASHPGTARNTTAIELGPARFERGAANVGELAFALETMGRGTALLALERDAPARMVAGEVRLDRGEGAVEWWRRAGSGLEHGVDLATRPPGEGPLQLRISLGDHVRTELASDDVILLHGERGSLGSYSHLVVRDASGARVPARLAAGGSAVLVEIDDTHALYPIVVDPLFLPEEAVLDIGTARTWFGRAVALDAHADRAIVGSELERVGTLTQAGAARVYVRSGTTWALEAVLTPPDAAVLDAFGASVAISGDGSIVAIGASLDATSGSTRTGSVRVFVRSGTTWAYEAMLVPAAPLASNARFGARVGISRDGARVIAGAPSDDPGGAGSASIFARSGTSWTQEATMRGNTGDRFGSAVAISGDGSFALVGAPQYEAPGLQTDSGAVRSLRRTGTSWAVEATSFPFDGASTPVVGLWFGSSIAMSDDGSVALVGAPMHAPASPAGAPRLGAVYTLVRGTGGTFGDGNALPTPAAVLPDAWYGVSVGIDAAGTRAVVGANDTNSPGAVAGTAYVLEGSGGAWSVGGSLVPSILDADDEFGISVGIDGDGARAIVGAFQAAAVDGSFGEGRVHLFSIEPQRATGTACSLDAQCTSGFCTDGVCCTERCAGGTSDCRACSAGAGSSDDGTCEPLGAGVVCRASATACDRDETCDGVATDCPVNRPAVGRTVCRARAAGQLCDAPEACDGVAYDCPPDALEPNGAICGGAGSCTTEARCSGSAGTCPSASLEPAGTVCLPRAVDGSGRPLVCDVDDVCDGVMPDCPARYRAAGVECAAASAEICDAPDMCTGTSADCVPTFLAGAVCRDAAGACDAAEACSGASASCPPDLREAAGMTCRASVDPACDPTEACDGVAGACPADVTACVSPDAAATDAGDMGPADAGVSAATAGCSCRGASRANGPGAAIVTCALLVATAWRAQRHRTRGRRGLASTKTATPP